MKQFISQFTIKNLPDLLSGLLFIALGVFAFIIALGYDMGTAQRMGPGYFPMILSLFLAGLGLLITLVSLGRTRDDAEMADSDSAEAEEPPKAEEEVEAPPLRDSARAMLFVSVALILFAVLLPHIGLVLAVWTLVLVGSFAEKGLGWLATLVIAAFMSFVAVAIFRWGIGLPFPIWP